MILTVLQVVVAVALVVLILLQERSAGLSAIFGADSGFYQTRRGLEQVIFASTIVLSFVFVAIALFRLVR